MMLVSLYASIPAEEARELADTPVGKLVDYAIDDDVVTEFNRSKEQATLKRRRKLAPCCRRNKEDACVAPAVAAKTGRPQFAAEIDGLAESATALEYRIERAEEGESPPRWKRCYHAAREFVSGRCYKVSRCRHTDTSAPRLTLVSMFQCIIRTIRLVIEIGLVIHPSAVWLPVFFLLSFPSTLMDSLQILWSCGVAVGSLNALLVNCSPCLVVLVWYGVVQLVISRVLLFSFFVAVQHQSW